MNSALLRTLVIYAIILPLAVVIGWMAVDLADWNRTSFAVVAATLFVLLLPVLLKWHYPLMVFSWQTAVTVFFLPGQPSLWMLMAGITMAFAIGHRIVQKRPTFFSAPSITIPLLALAGVVLVTAYIRGGVGLVSLGSSSVGSKSYVAVLAAIMGYFAFASRGIPVENAKLYTRLFFLSALIPAGSILVYYAGPSFYFLFLVFPVGFAAVQAMSEYADVTRLAGLTVSASAVAFYMLARVGVRGVLTKWHRLIIMIGVAGLGAMGGYRSTMAVIGLVFVVLFLVEGLLRSPIFPILLLVGGLGFAILVPFSTKLPPQIQRSLSFMPLEIDPNIRHDAEGSLEWRWEMWKLLIPDLPKYFWVGKGYALNLTDLYLTHQAELYGRAENYQASLLAGDYHSGPFSVYIPFGVFGSLAFVVFLASSTRALYLNHLYGPAELRGLNRFLYAFFLARLIFFIVGFGALASDLSSFAGIIGLSMALNKGICRQVVTAPKPVQFRGSLRLRPSQGSLA